MVDFVEHKRCSKCGGVIFTRDDLFFSDNFKSGRVDAYFEDRHMNCKTSIWATEMKKAAQENTNEKQRGI